MVRQITIFVLLGLMAFLGSVVRIAPQEYSIDDPEAAKIIYGLGSQFFKSDWYTVWSDPSTFHTNLFALQDAKQHASVRRQFASFYSMTALVHYESYVNECINIFSCRLDTFSKSGQKIDMGRWLQYYAFDVIANITFGEPFGCLKEGVDIGSVIEDLDKIMLYSSLMGFCPPLHFLIGRLPLHPAKYLMSLIRESIEKRKMADKKDIPSSTPDFLDKFVDSFDNSPKKFTYEHVFTGCAQNILAGSDTTSIALSSIIFHLLHEPSTLSKLREEIRTAVKNGSISNPITFAESRDLVYLQAVIKEGLRINPSTGLPIGRVVPPGGARISGVFFPEGTIVGINSWVAHRNKAVFGDDVDRFRPERWLEASKEKLQVMDHYMMPFGIGSRTCIGKNISMLEISKLIPQLVRSFDFQLEDERLVGRNHWFVKPVGFRVIVSKFEDRF